MIDEDKEMRWVGSDYRSLREITVSEVVKG